MAELYIGLMSGTSADAVDAALVRFAPSPTVLYARTFELAPALRSRIRAVNAQSPLAEIATLDVLLGRLFADCVNSLLATAGIEPAAVRAIGSHGQTVWHQPFGDTPFTLQIGDPNIISELTGIATVADFRRRDIAAGGQGAPLVPAFHAQIFRSPDEDRCVLNLGGIANITLLPKDARAPIVGFDTGPANTLLDAWVNRHQGLSCDVGGAWAATGRPSEELLVRLLDDPYFQAPPPKSTGREHFNLDWLDGHLKRLPALAPEDVQATLVQLTAQSVARALAAHAGDCARVLVCGGGVHNPQVMKALATTLHPIAVESTAASGIDPDFVEACAFAWLARQTVAGLPGNLASVTGARHDAVLGGIYAGRALRR